MNKRARSIAVLLVALGVLGAKERVAHADDGKADKASADALFAEAKALMQAERYVEACPKFAASNAIDPGVGGLLWQGECEERANHPLAAWQSFSAAEAMATRRGDARATVARDRREKLDAVVAHLHVDTDAANVHLDGAEIARDAAVEPGPHLVVVTRDDGATWSATALARAGEVVTLHPVFVADLAAPEGPVAVAPPASTAPVVRPPATPPASAVAARGNPTWVGIGIGGAAAGLVGIGAGLYLGAEAKSVYDTAQSSGHCTASNQCDAEGLHDRSHASALARDATVFVAAGAGVTALGAVVAIKWWNVRVAPTVGRASAGLTAVGTF